MNERVRTNNKYNLELYNENRIDGKYQIPIIECDNYIPKELISFNYAMSSKNKNVGVHFYVDDYQFERIWNNPYRYISLLKQYKCIFSPDFSLYQDMPLAMKIWNVYRSRVIGQFYQKFGIKVIPTISWSGEDTYSFCFDGIPKGSIVSISTVGIIRNKESMQMFKNGVDEMTNRIHPKSILIYGHRVNYDFGDIEVIYYENSNEKRLRDIKKGVE